jgi:hypothetical protein
MLCHKWASDGASLAGMCVKEMKTLVTACNWLSGQWRICLVCLSYLFGVGKNWEKEGSRRPVYYNLNILSHIFWFSEKTSSKFENKILKFFGALPLVF